MIIEFMGVVTKDKALAKRYDQLAYDFIKISLTAYSLTAILGGILIFTFLTLYPAFFGYLSSIFRPVMHIYALMFVAESGTLYIYYYGWDKMKEGFLTRLEYRRDWSDQPFFDRGNGLANYRSQDTITLGMIVFFGPKR